MAIKNLFKSFRGALLPKTDTVNHAHAQAYALDSRTALAQLAATGCFGNTFYVSGQEQLDLVVKHASACDPMFVAKVAIYARQRGYMKDMPAVLLAHLSTRDAEGSMCMKLAFPRVVDNGRMLRNFVQVMRSGQLARKSLGTAPKQQVQKWLASRSAMQLFRDSVGNAPSLADVVKMVHPKPKDDEQKAMYGYLLGRAHDTEKLPHAVRAFEAWKQGETRGDVPDVPARMLDGLTLDRSDWVTIATRASWQETRMNLNTYQRHGVLMDADVTALLAQRLASADEVRKAKAFPYQLLMTWKAASSIPNVLQEALQSAMEHAVANVPRIEGNVVICVDVSGSMQSPVTGHRKGATSAVRCIDVAGLMAATMLRQNPHARVIPFENDVRQLRLNPRDSVMTLATQLAAIGGGGTNCSAPLALLTREKAKVDAVIYVSDNESWVDAKDHAAHRTTGVMALWQDVRSRNPQAKLVCIDVTPNTTKQAIDRPDILNVGGFSDAVFDVVAQFVKADRDAQHWARVIEQQQL